jgi:undecaprenyl-diphosphatase
MMEYLTAVFLGLVEGITEYLPVSSTGHLLLVQHFLGLDSEKDKTFAILVQLGAILALLAVYFNRLWAVAKALPTSAEARNFVLGVLIAFLPAAIVGFFALKFIKSVLFNPWIVCFTLIMGGLVLIIIDALPLKEKHQDAMKFSLPMCLMIGLVQCISMVPGVSRSGATIVGAMLLGASKRAAAEFSFFLAIPTLGGAFALELFKTYKEFNTSSLSLVAAGFVVSLLSGLVVVKYFLDYVARYGFGLFAWWRIIVGALGLAALVIWG